MLCFHRFFQLSSILIFEQEGEKKVLKGVLKLKKPKATHQEKRKHKSNKQQKIVRNSCFYMPLCKYKPSNVNPNDRCDVPERSVNLHVDDILGT